MFYWTTTSVTTDFCGLQARTGQVSGIAPVLWINRKRSNRATHLESGDVVAQVGDMLVFEPNSSVGHNLNPGFFRNLIPAYSLPPGTPIQYELSSPEPAPVPLECNIHPWMRGYLMVLEHPFVDISDVDGRVLIPNLPNDMEITFRVFHEAASGPLTNVTVNGEQTTWERSKFSITTGDDVTDIGIVTLKPENFSEELVQP